MLDFSNKGGKTNEILWISSGLVLGRDVCRRRGWFYCRRCRSLLIPGSTRSVESHFLSIIVCEEHETVAESVYSVITGPRSVICSF